MSLKLSAGCKCCDGGGCPICGGPIDMVLIFIDESTPYSTGTATYDADVVDWDATVAGFGAPKFAQLCEVWEYGATVPPTLATSNCKPTTRNLPDDWTYDTLVRGPTEAECKAVYDSAKGGAAVPHPSNLVFLGVDNSGSMTEATLGAGFTDFKAYLTAEGVEWRQILFDNERWVLLTADNYEAAVANPAEFDVTLSGFANHASGRCTGCSNLDDVYTLTQETTPTVDCDCSWKYEASEYSGGHYADCDTGVVQVFIHQIILCLTRTVIGIQTRFTWELMIITNGGEVVSVWDSWTKQHLVWEAGEPETTACNFSHLFENLNPGLGNVAYCIAIDGTTTANVEVG